MLVCTTTVRAGHEPAGAARSSKPFSDTSCQVVVGSRQLPGYHGTSAVHYQGLAHLQNTCCMLRSALRCCLKRQIFALRLAAAEDVPQMVQKECLDKHSIGCCISRGVGRMQHDAPFKRSYLKQLRSFLDTGCQIRVCKAMLTELPGDGRSFPGTLIPETASICFFF